MHADMHHKVVTMEFWNIEAMTGYKPISTFWQDFSIAEHYGQTGIMDTYNRAFDGWKHDYKMITELVMVLNWRCWRWWDLKNYEISKLYANLYAQLDEWCGKNLKGEEARYYYTVTD